MRKTSKLEEELQKMGVEQSQQQDGIIPSSPPATFSFVPRLNQCRPILKVWFER
jgi:hypothetical protein